MTAQSQTYTAEALKQISKKMLILWALVMENMGKKLQDESRHILNMLISMVW